jgi:ABC-type dipeptide/oligopeptide/nickel transport system permease component
VMPLLTLTVDAVAGIARLTRGSMLDVLRHDYLDSARAKGVSEKIVIYKHALRNALIPVVTIIGLHLGTLIGGTVVVETVFAFPGLGSLIVQAAQHRDFPVIQYGVMLVATTVIVVNLLVDLSYGLLDPRIRDNF